MNRALILAGLLALVGVAPASAATPNCPRRANTIARDSIGRVWHQQRSVFACTTAYGHRPVARRLGPWTRGTKVAFDGENVVWTTRVLRGGRGVDRAWAANADSGERWLSGAQAVPASGSAAAREALVTRLLGTDRGAAWSTDAGDVVVALESPNSDIEASAPVPAPAGNVALIGSFPQADPAALPASLRFTEGDGEGDECGGTNPYTVTATPDPASAPISATWFGDWVSTNC